MKHGGHVKLFQIKPLLVLAFSVATLITAFSNCGQPGSISQKVATVIETEIHETISNCDNAQAAGNLVIHNEVVNFEDTKIESGRNQICQFNQGDNLEMNDSYMQARYEQEHKLNIPLNAVVCDVKMTSTLQKFRYDDVFFFTFNNHLLATNNKTAINERLTPLEVNLNNKRVKFYDYNWLALRGAHFENVADDFCVGQAEGLSSCSWPVSEQQGSIVFNIDRQILVGLGLARAGGEHKFGFVITGDNDPDIDCFHEKVSFAMQVKYYIPSN